MIGVPAGPIVARLRAAGCVFAEDEARLLAGAAQTLAELTDLVDRRVTGIPLEHVLGWTEFCGVRVAVEPGVFVPRRRTEYLVEQARAALRDGSVVVDLCCGSGCVGAALLAAVPGIDLYAADLDPAAVRCARRNLPADRVFEGDLYAALPAWVRGRIDVLVVNAPYVPTGEIDLLPQDARLHEPPTALDGGPDGLDIQRRVVTGASDWLVPSGVLLIESSDVQAAELARAFTTTGFDAAVRRSADLGTTVVVGTSRTAA